MSSEDWRAVPCRIWEGAKDPGGYGHRNHHGRTVGVHRIAWEEANGPIPAGLYVLHHCDVRACYEIRHLFVGTQADNIADMVRKGRAHSGRLPGERNPNVKWSDDAVALVRQRFRAGEKQADLCRRFGIPQPTISKWLRNVARIVEGGAE